MKNILNFSIFLIIFSSCTKITEIEINNNIEGLVINSFISPNDSININLSKVVDILDTQHIYIDSATILLYQNSKYIRRLVYKGQGNYFTSFHPHRDSIYSLEIEYNNQIYNIEDTVPGKIAIDSIVLSNSIRYDQNNDEYYTKANIYFTDPLGKNYYEIQILDRFDYSHLGETDNEIVRNENLENYIGYSIVFSDELFNNSQCNFEIEYALNLGNSDSTINTCILRHVSYSYYMYKKYYLMHIFHQPSSSYGVLDFFKGEPVEMFSNITNGYGIFAAYSEEIKSIF